MGMKNEEEKGAVIVVVSHLRETTRACVRTTQSGGDEGGRRTYPIAEARGTNDIASSVYVE